MKNKQTKLLYAVIMVQFMIMGWLVTQAPHAENIVYNTWWPDTCECVFTFSFDADLPPAQRVHKLYSVDHRCEWHSGLADEATLWLHAKEQNFRKNDIPERLAIALGYVDEEGYAVMPDFYANHDYYWSYSGYNELRLLSVSVTNINNGEKTNIQKILDGYYGTEKVELSIASSTP